MLITVLLISGLQKVPSIKKKPRNSWTSIPKHSLIEPLVLLQSYRKYNTTRAKHYWLQCMCEFETSCSHCKTDPRVNSNQSYNSLMRVCASAHLKHIHFRPFKYDKNLNEFPWLEMCSCTIGLKKIIFFY